MNDHVVPKEALDNLLDYADALAAEVRLVAVEDKVNGHDERADELNILVDRYEASRRAIEDLGNI